MALPPPPPDRENPAPRSGSDHPLLANRRGYYREMNYGVSLWDEFSPALALWVLILITIGIGSIVIGHMDVDVPTADTVICMVAAVIVLMFCAPVWPRLRPLLAFREPGGWVWLQMLGALVLTWLFMTPYTWALSDLLGISIIEITADFRDEGWPVWAVFLTMSIYPAVFEELAFRGVIMARLERVMKSKDAMIVQAAMFSIIHLAPANFISHFVLGLAFGWLRVKTKSLYPSMVVHAAWNAIVVAEEYLAG